MRSEAQTDLDSARDGRVVRRERNREAIIDAVVDLVGEGVVEPTADLVAERAGVQARTLFRHFDDMTQLHREITARVRARILPLLTSPPDLRLPLSERLHTLIQQRSRLFEAAAPYRRSQEVRRHRHDFAQAEHQRSVRELRAHLLTWLPELRELEPEAMAAFEMATSHEAWLRLRDQQRLGAARACAAMEYAARAVLGER